MTLDVITLGETLGLVRPLGSGRLRHCRGAELGVGGAESNLAIGVARLGRRAAWIGRVGDDPWGGLVLDELRAEGVDVSGARVDRERPTAVMLKHRDAGGATSVTYLRHGSAGSALCPDDVPIEAVSRARILHVTGITPALSPSAAAAVERAVSIAREAGRLVSFDLNHRARLWSAADAAPVLRELSAAADVVFAGEDEARLIVDAADAEEACRALAALGPAHVVVKRGGAGAVALVDGTLHRVPPARVAHVVDPVGAGDAFAAGYLVGVLEGHPAADALVLAARAGALAVTTPGDWESSPDRAALERADAPTEVER
jgi:2-dehydro-3-deoxygluconokinase